MDPSKDQSAINLPLERLVARALSELEKRRYSRRSLRRYRKVWRQLVAFSHDIKPEDKYSEDLATRFANTYQIREGECLKPSDQWRRHVTFGLKALGDFAREGCIERSRINMRQTQIPTLMQKPLQEYEQYCKDRLHLRPTTLCERMRELAIFADFLRSRDTTILNQLQPADLSAFVISRPRLAAKTVSRIVSDVRSFLKFLLLRGILQRDLRYVLPTIRVPRDAAIPSVWDPELLVQLLNAVDRSSPIGKRDYAILLLACRLGLRDEDIRALRLDNLKWETATIETTQLKTLTPLCLPLTEEVGQALIDYLKSGRPQSDQRQVFLTLKPPFLPFGNKSNLYRTVTRWRQLAGIHFQAKQRHGLHSLRHSLATKLLREQTPIHVISEILGHATTASTLIYAKADVEALRTAALDLEEVPYVE